MENAKHAERILALEQTVVALAADIQTSVELSRLKSRCPDLYSSTIQRHAEVIASCLVAVNARGAGAGCRNANLARELRGSIARKEQLDDLLKEV